MGGIVKRLNPGTAVIFKEGGKRIKGVVVKYSDSFIGSEKMRAKIEKKNLILVQVNTLKWIPRDSIIEVLGKDFWFGRYSNPSSTKVEKV